MYCTKNFQSKKALKDAIAAGEQHGICQAGPFGGNELTDGKVCLEGPWYPQPHKWYATAQIKDGKIVKVS